MTISNLASASAFDNDYDVNEIDEILRLNDHYILALAREKVPRHMVSPDVLDLEIYELAQRARIKLWRSLQKRHITHIKAYIKCIIHSESMDMIRRGKSDLPLPLDEEGELYQGGVLMVPSEGMRDPLYELEQKEMAAEYITQAVDILRSLPRCQQQAMVCSLKDQLDDVLALTKAFRKFEMNIEAVRWPSERKEVQNLKASLSIARKKLRSVLRSELYTQNSPVKSVTLSE
jgi:DNA-directed RNA polymerase specialized sigma24 family protein